MNQTISLNGTWLFCLDTDKEGLDAHFEKKEFSDTITLPGTISLAQKGSRSSARETGFLTDPYRMEGYSWYKRTVTLPFSDAADMEGWRFTLSLERTRISKVWVDGQEVGSFDSFVAVHRYDLTPWIHRTEPELTIMVSNTDYKVPGGHLTSPDTQTNWNGILGDISLRCERGPAITAVETKGDAAHGTVAVIVRGNYEGIFPCNTDGQGLDNSSSRSRNNGTYGKLSVLISAVPCRLKDAFLKKDANVKELLPSTAPENHTPDDVLVSTLMDTETPLPEKEYPLATDADEFSGTFTYALFTDKRPAALWSEFAPNLYQITVSLCAEGGEVVDSKTTLFGLRDFLAEGDHFSINGRRTFLRGKHDGMIFPLTGFAPMSVEGWLSAMATSRDFGINHYRFHTCCPPEAAFVAADLLGIYLEPELPFWGTFNGPGDEGYNEEAQMFLRAEGFRILEQFSSHPSFCMMSMGNELWGNPSAINDLLAEYKSFRPHILFTQGSNNFQWVPNIQPMDDFFCGVRFTIDRQIRGSYAMCDKPLGHVQTKAPGTRTNYEEAIHPSYHAKSGELSEDGTIEIQYGTGVKRVKLTEAEAELIPSVPVVSHEIGQYCTYPDFREIDAYVGVLKAENFAIFKERLEEKGLGSLAFDYFKNSGALAVACYKDELETALRTPSLAGFQILDIQDFSGQGTALVGVLNAFMENKGLVSAPAWREFCSDAVIQAEFDSYLVHAGEDFSFTASLAFFREGTLTGSVLSITLTDAFSGKVAVQLEQPVENTSEPGRQVFGDFSVRIPEDAGAGKYALTVALKGTDIVNHYTLWSYDDEVLQDATVSSVVKNVSAGLSETASQPAVAFTRAQAHNLAKMHKRVLLFLSDEENPDSIEGTYCTDFWCYPMFRSISESMGKEIPVGTLGLLIDHAHPALAQFPSETYSTPQWYSIVTASRSTILDDTDIRPIVQTIDNFERNHRLGLLYEQVLDDLGATLVICTSDLPRLIKEGYVEAAQLMKSLLAYVAGAE
jgi:hypothetical protein